jgi:hypothetical protein
VSVPDLELALKVFRDDEARQETLAIVWPELHEALVGPPAVGGDEGPIRVCSMGEHSPSAGVAGPRPLAVGRVGRNGHPACRRHLDEFGDAHPLRWLRAGEVAG